MIEKKEDKVDLKRWLPTTKKEMELRGWQDVDVVLFTGDAYIDHPSFGAAIIGRIIENCGWKVAIVPQPDWHGDWRDFKKFGKPNKFFAVSAGVMDSMVNHYTAGKRLRHDDAYTPDGRHGARPDRATIVYTKILKELYPDVPVVIGGIEASLRRLAHYDYWDDEYKPSILVDSGADLLLYGMGEKVMREVCRAFDNGGIEACKKLRQVSYISAERFEGKDAVRLKSFEDCRKDRRVAVENFKTIEQESNKLNDTVLVQRTGNVDIIVNPPFAPISTEELDAVHELPFTRLPHPKYKGKRIPAFDMIRWSVNTHRGCWGGCAFCTISMHQGKFIVSRSKESILKEVRLMTADPEFKGYLSDLGGPSANMYMMRGRDAEKCKKCMRPSCAYPKICPNMDTDHGKLLELYRAVDELPGIKKSFIGSGVRYDVAMHETGDERIDANNRKYVDELIARHVSGKLKVAPEHTSDKVLKLMRKPSFSLYYEFKKRFDRVNRAEGLKQLLIPYFISSHPGCSMKEMNELHETVKNIGVRLEQVQDFTPTPMTYATEMFHAGIDPYTGEKVFVERDLKKKGEQKSRFFVEPLSGTEGHGGFQRN